MRGRADVDVLVVGAGPAGAAAAITAARRGALVALVDRARFPRDKTCGDGLTAEALRLLEALGVELPAGSTQVVRRVVLVSPRGRRVHLPMPGDGWHAAVVARRDLDHRLVRTAAAAGAQVVEGAEVTGVHPERDGVTVVTADGTARRARWVVAADGPWSALRRLLDGAPHRPGLGGWTAFRRYVRGVDDDRLWVCFAAELLPGYAWVFPLPGGRANVGFGVPRDPSVPGRTLARRWRELWHGPLAEVLGPDVEADDRDRAWPIPTDFRPEHLAAGRVLFAGDAAGVVDPMTGEGIAQALATGIAAARAVTAPHPGPASAGDPAAEADRVGAAYRRAVVGRLGADLRLAAALGRVLAHPLGAHAALRAVDTCDWTRRCFARWMFEDYPRALLGTPRRWRRGVFRPAGAYRREGAPRLSPGAAG